MRHYRAQLVSGELLGLLWCDICDEAKHAACRLTPLGAQPRAIAADEETWVLCEGCSEGLEDGAVVTESDLEERRQRRRGSQEP